MREFVVHFTIPSRFSKEQHPLGAGPDDWFDVKLDAETPAAAEHEARLLVNDRFGDRIWCSTHLDPEWEMIRSRFYPGQCVHDIRPA